MSCTCCESVVFVWLQQRVTELERTQKWVKMTKKWDKYFPGEKVRCCMCVTHVTSCSCLLSQCAMQSHLCHCQCATWSCLVHVSCVSIPLGHISCVSVPPGHRSRVSVPLSHICISVSLGHIMCQCATQSHLLY